MKIIDRKASKNLSFTEYAFILWTILYPIASIYQAPFLSALTLGDIGYFIIIPLLLIKKKPKKIAFIPGIILILFVVPYLFLAPNLDILFRTARFIFSLVVLSFFIPSFFPKEEVLPLLKAVAVISALYIILQFIMAKLFWYNLPGTLPFLNATQSIQVLYDANGKITMFRRFQGFFSEPSTVGIFLSTTLACSLSEKKKTLVQYIPELVMCVGIILSQGTTGMGLLVIILAYWFLHSNQNKWKAILASFPILLLIELRYDLIRKSFQRLAQVQKGSGFQLGVAAIRRIKDFGTAFNAKGLTPVEIIFGRGMKLPEVFIPGWGRCFMYFGIVGLICFISFYTILFLKTKGYARILVVCIIVLNFFADIMFGISPLLILPFISMLSRKQTTYEVHPFSRRLLLSISK